VEWNGRHYLLCPTSAFDRAVADAESRGGMLASADSKPEAAMLRSMCSSIDSKQVLVWFPAKRNGRDEWKNPHTGADVKARIATASQPHLEPFAAYDVNTFALVATRRRGKCQYIIEWPY
jgi:hypothetical protein